MELVDVDCECTTVVCGFVIVKGNDMFADVEFLLSTLINIRDFSAFTVSFRLDFISVDVNDGADEDNGRFAVAPTGDDKVSFDVADECVKIMSVNIKAKEEEKGEERVYHLNYSCNKFSFMFIVQWHSETSTRACTGWMCNKCVIFSLEVCAVSRCVFFFCQNSK